MNLGKWEYKIDSEHSLMTTFLCFNSTHDKFITCGEEGEINTYSLGKSQRIMKLSYAKIFEQQAIICVKWANPMAGGKIGVAGSKGSLAILNIDDQYGQIKCEDQVKNIRTENKSNTDCIVDMDWHPTKKLLLCSTNQSIILYKQIGLGWEKSLLMFQKLPTQIRICWGISNQYFLFLSVGEKLHIYDHERSLDKLFIPVQSYANQKIQQILCRNEMNAENYLEVLILTDQKIRVIKINFINNTLNYQKQQIQQININKLNLCRLFWGLSQNQIVCFPKCKRQTKNQVKMAEEKVLYSPVVFNRRVSGIWESAN